MKIIRATVDHADDVAELFDQYRQFYEQPADPGLARQFINDRLRNEESIIFLAKQNGQAVGFTQLYPSFCSVAASKIMILYDLFVASGARRHGVGEALMNKATEYAKHCSAARLDLLTEKTNLPGQSLYEKLGYVKTNEQIYAYSLALPPA